MKNIGSMIPESLKGYLYIAVGFLVLLYTLGILEKSMNHIIMITAILAIVYGFFKSGLNTKLIQFTKRNDTNNS